MDSVSSSDIQKLVSARQQLEAQLNENKVVQEVNYNYLRSPPSPNPKITQ